MKGLATSFLLIYVTLLTGQSILVSEGLDIRSDLSYELLGDFGDKYMVASYSDDKFTIHNYDTELFLTSEQEFFLPEKRARIIHVYPYEDRFSLLYTLPDRDTIWVVNQSYNSTFDKLKADTLLQLEKDFRSLSFRYTFSEDKKKLGLTVIRGEDLIHYMVYDVAYEEIVHESPLDLGPFAFYDDYRKSVLSNSGILYLIFEQNNTFRKMDEHAFFIYKIRDANAVEESILPMKTMLTYDAKFLYDNRNNKLIICGLGSEENRDRAEMIFQVKQDPKDPDYFEFLTFVFHNNLLNDFYGPNRKARIDYLQNVQIQDVVLLDDGSSVLLLEEVRKLQRVTTGGRIDYYGSRFTVDYHYENILLFYLIDSGESWQKLLPKRQFSNDDEGAYSSYFLFKNPIHFRLIYNDEIRNENTVSEYIIRPNGSSLRTNLLSTEFQRLRLQVRHGMQLSGHRLIIPSVRGKEMKLLLIDYLN